MLGAYRAKLEAAPDNAGCLAEIRDRLIRVQSPFRIVERFGIEDIIDPGATRPRLRAFAELAGASSSKTPPALRGRTGAASGRDKAAIQARLAKGRHLTATLERQVRRVRGALQQYRRGRGPVTCLAFALLALGATPSGGLPTHSDALWRVVHNLCLPDRVVTGLSAPCLEVNPAAGYAVVPDPKKPDHLLLVPTRRLTGIEDPALLEPGLPNYWREAWKARKHLEARLKRTLPREGVGLAVNAIAGRSQEQLHIHISCIRPQVTRDLEAAASNIGPRWSNQLVLGWRWRVRSLLGSDLSAADPFRLLADEDALARATMGDQTLVVVGAKLPQGDGFYLLSRSTDPSGDSPGHGELLLDEGCSQDGI